jgi:3-deoxy-D-manno-octulosonate 8-phosphate phosphatase (KDO 8-P phosphatase)
MVNHMFNINDTILSKIKNIKLLLSDSDGVLTDGGVYYSPNGEELKKFSIRDGMGVSRLRDLVQVETGIITGENSLPVQHRAEKLNIKELHLGVQDKLAILHKILDRQQLSKENIAYVGDDSNDIEIIKEAGLSACPADAMYFIKDKVDYICQNKGGEGAFREFAELIICGKSRI